MGSIGFAEMLALLVVAVVCWLVPVVVAIRALVTLSRIQLGQVDLAERLQAIERLLQAGR